MGVGRGHCVPHLITAGAFGLVALAVGLPLAGMRSGVVLEFD